jgi:hypothetical protein
MKATIKKLSADIEKVLDDTAEANYYNGLIDGGEWSQVGPDFSDLIKRWELTREQLINYISIANKHASDNFTCIFMAGFLNE